MVAKETFYANKKEANNISHVQTKPTYEVTKPINSIRSQQLLKSNEVTYGKLKKPIVSLILTNGLAKNINCNQQGKLLKRVVPIFQATCIMFFFCDYNKKSLFHRWKRCYKKLVSWIINIRRFRAKVSLLCFWL